MKRNSCFGSLLLVLAILLLGSTYSQAAPPSESQSTNKSLTLWYRQPAKEWVEAMPIGNGRLGAMVFGAVPVERLQLNEDTLWAGGPYAPANSNALAALPEVRNLVFDGKFVEADKLIGQKVMAVPLRQMPYQTLGDLFLDFDHTQQAQDYRRELDLQTATATVSYTVGDVHYTREIFASYPDRVIVLRLTADKPGKVQFSASFKTPQRAQASIEKDTLVLTGVNGEAQGIEGALKFQARVRVLPRGAQAKLSPAGESLSLRDADSALVIITAATSYKNYKDVTGDPVAITKKAVSGASSKGYDALYARHLKDYRALFDRVQLDLGGSAGMNLPTNERIKAFPDAIDPQFAVLYFQFGRYLLISSSRPGGQPANLQGMWNESMKPPWESKYTININTEMNYWPAEVCNLPECVDPLIAMVKDLSSTGQRTARVMYGARGWVTHHNTDLWRATAPVDKPGSGMWPMGGAWLCQHLWDHYQFHPDKAYLADIYPVLKGASEFFVDTLVEHPTKKWLVTNPSSSPENRHSKVTVCAGPAMDMEILRDLFDNCIQASEILGKDETFREQLRNVRGRLAPLQIGAQGQLQEWLDDWDATAPEQKHRHISHLYALHPSNQITPRGTPDLAEAAKVTLNTRGDITTGWAIAWRINCWARLLDGERTLSILKHLFTASRTYPNMFDAHPPFQIDGNFGGANGIAQMLLQSQTAEIELLPALPAEWANGSVKGLRARGGFEVDMAWKDAKLTQAVIRSINGGKAVLRYKDVVLPVEIKKGSEFRWDGRNSAR